MSGIFDIVQQQLGAGGIQRVAEQTGLDPAVAQKAVTAAVPMILGGMAQHAKQRGNAEVIHAEADNHSSHTGALGDVPNVFTGAGAGGGLLGKIMGDRHAAVQDGVAKAAGIDKSQAAKVVAVGAAAVLGAIALKKRQGQLSPQDVSGSLQQAQQQAQTHAQTSAPNMGGILGSVMGQIMNREGPRA
jgi:hypothetical protein